MVLKMNRGVPGWLPVMLVIWFSWFPPGPAQGAELSEYGNPFLWVSVGQVKVKAEVVSTAEALYRGLGYRRELPEGRGMLFFMPRLEVQDFCMRGMEFPIDIIWIVQGKIVGLEKNLSPNFTGTVYSPQPVNYVLEVPGGFAEEYGIRVGDRVSWEGMARR
jgi:uncharacterized membrane protein (UPF0127 family)